MEFENRFDGDQVDLTKACAIVCRKDFIAVTAQVIGGLRLTPCAEQLGRRHHARPPSLAAKYFFKNDGRCAGVMP